METRKTDGNILTSIPTTHHNGKVIRNADFLGEDFFSNLNDSGVDLTPTQPQSTLAALSSSGAPISWDQHKTNYQIPDTQYSRQIEEDITLANFNF